MSTYEIILPKMGEGIIEATIIRWLKNEGELVAADESILEIATDKVDSEIVSSNDGYLVKHFFKEGDVVAIGSVVAMVSSENKTFEDTPVVNKVKSDDLQPDKDILSEESLPPKNEEIVATSRFYSPLVRNMARVENISIGELETIQGSGENGRITKTDIENLILSRYQNTSSSLENKVITNTLEPNKINSANQNTQSISDGDRVEEMDRMRKMIANHMNMSIQTSAHVTSIIEVNMSKIVNWRNKIKEVFLKREGEKITITPIVFNIVAQALKEFPGINASVDGSNIIYRKNIHIGMATLLPNGNLIVPVVKNADQKSLLGLTKNINDLASRARASKLLPDEIQGGTFSITNLGAFDTLLGTPIINQPQVAILAIGAIRKQPIVIESEFGDSLGIAPMMYLSLSYDHRIVDGGMGGLFIKRVKELLESFNEETVI